ncbi:MAG: EamA family transporter [Patescibacteria group bacterium]|jgi:drug/metabolite transporter (DMT)-like permease|nr:EamA family transporter [Patescibacteria group bacterium]
MLWIIVALSSYLLLAVANIIDKFLVDNVLKSSKAYAFVACIMGLVVFLVAPWFLKWPGIGIFAFNIINGFVFAVALWSLYEALVRGEASRILVLVGGLTPIFSLLFSILFFGDKFSSNQWTGLTVILTGVFLIAFLPKKRSWLSRVLKNVPFKLKENKGGLYIAVLSAFFYSLYFIGTKTAYTNQEFISAFIWTRLGAAIFVLIFLFNIKDRLAIKKILNKKEPNKNKFLVVFNQMIGSSGFLLQNYAIFLGSVVLVNALQGTQYAFILIISTVLALMRPKLLKETFSIRILSQKVLAVVLIAVGLYFLTI